MRLSSGSGATICNQERHHVSPVLELAYRAPTCPDAQQLARMGNLNSELLTPEWSYSGGDDLPGAPAGDGGV